VRSQQPPFAKRDVLSVTRDHVVEHLDPDDPAGFGDALGEFDVLRARIRDAGGMVVRQDDRRGGRLDRGSENLAGLCCGRTYVASDRRVLRQRALATT